MKLRLPSPCTLTVVTTLLQPLDLSNLIIDEMQKLPSSDEALGAPATLNESQQEALCTLAQKLQEHPRQP